MPSSGLVRGAVLSKPTLRSEPPAGDVEEEARFKLHERWRPQGRINQDDVITDRKRRNNKVIPRCYCGTIRPKIEWIEAITGHRLSPEGGTGGSIVEEAGNRVPV